MTVKMIHPGICIFDAFSLDECDAILALVSSSLLWQKGEIRTRNGGRTFSDIRQQDVIKEKNATGQMAHYGNLFSERVVTILQSLQEHFGIGTFDRDFFQYQRTTLGGRYMWHKDGIYAAVSVAYLTDQVSHGLKGGATAFDIGGEKFEIQPERGKAVLFNGNILHKGAIVRDGIKIALVAAFFGSQRPRPPSVASVASGAGSSDASSGIP